MPDPYAKLTAAVVEIGTQLRRVADAHTTPTDDSLPAKVDEATATLRRLRHVPLCHACRFTVDQTLAGPRPDAPTATADDARCPTPETHNWGCGCPTDHSTHILRAQAAEQRAEAMERAMESTAADALKHRGCHRDLMAQCQRAEQAEAAIARVEAAAHDLRHKDAMRILAALDPKEAQ